MKALFYKSNTVKIFFMIIALIIQVIPVQARTAEQINMVIGQQRVFNYPGVTRIAIGNPSVANPHVTKNNEIVLTAISEGLTELSIWQGTHIRTFTVSVSTIDINKLAREVKRLIGRREGIRVRSSGDRLYIEGKALTLEDIERVEEIANLYTQVRSLVKLAPSAHSMIAQQINKILASAGLTNARATVVNSAVFLEGAVESQGELEKASMLVQNISGNVKNLLRIGPSRLVEAEVEFVELSLNSADKLGILWPTNIGGSINGTWTRTFIFDNRNSPETNQFSMGASVGPASFGVSLQFNDGATRILARPTLVTGSGQKAEFLVGGEVPLPIISEDRVSIEWKEYGIRLNFTPIVNADVIQTNILAEVSQVDRSVTVMDVPGFLTRRIKTAVAVKSGETIVLGGLLQRTEGKDVTKVPILGHIPIIGELFKSRNFTEGKTDLVVFITPRLVDPTHDRVKRAIVQMTQRYQKGEKEVGFSLFD